MWVMLRMLVHPSLYSSISPLESTSNGGCFQRSSAQMTWFAFCGFSINKLPPSLSCLDVLSHSQVNKIMKHHLTRLETRRIWIEPRWGIWYRDGHVLRTSSPYCKRFSYTNAWISICLMNWGSLLDRSAAQNSSRGWRSVHIGVYFPSKVLGTTIFTLACY